MPILVGGTGLYIDTVVKNIKLIKTKSDPNYRRQLNMLADRFGTEYLHQMLMLVDPDEAGKLPSSDRRRIIRALEIYKTTGATKTEQNALSRFAPQIYKAVWFGIKMQRELLYERINMRVDKMMQEGLLAEVENLIKMGLDKNATANAGNRL